MSEWQPIETAPTDGTTIVVRGPGMLPFLVHYVAACDFVEGGDDVLQWWTTDGQDVRWEDLSSWLPLPPPPLSSDEEAQRADTGSQQGQSQPDTEGKSA